MFSAAMGSPVKLCRLVIIFKITQPSEIWFALPRLCWPHSISWGQGLRVLAYHWDFTAVSHVAFLLFFSLMLTKRTGIVYNHQGWGDRDIRRFCDKAILLLGWNQDYYLLESSPLHMYLPEERKYLVRTWREFNPSLYIGCYIHYG